MLNLILVEPSFFQKNIWTPKLVCGCIQNDQPRKGVSENGVSFLDTWGTPTTKWAIPVVVLKTRCVSLKTDEHRDFRSARVLIHCSLVVYVTVKSTLVSKKHHLSVTYPLFQWLITAIKPQSFHQIQSHWCQRTIIYQYLSVIYPHFQWFQWLWNPIKP